MRASHLRLSSVGHHRSLKTIDFATLKADVARRFGLDREAGPTSPLSIGAEIELIPQISDTHAPVPIVGGKTNSVEIIRTIARERQWSEQSSADDPPSWSLPGGARISFEPGGQIEISSARHERASGLISELMQIIALLRDACDRESVLLTTRGVDAWNGIERVPLQLHRSRYARMARYFDSIGTSGARMMRQTASVQINVETGDRPLERWTLLNALAPYLTAIFANSARYESRDTGHASYRAHLWRTLDVSRTGLAARDDDPVATYTSFALDAGAIFSNTGENGYSTFREWMTEDAGSYDDWDLHLSMLFPEIRPKGFFEIRSTDMVSPEWLAAPIALIAGLVYHQPTSLRANELLAGSDSSLLSRAGVLAQRDRAISAVSRELVTLALSGCRQLESTYLSRADIETLETFADSYVYNGRSPADDSGP